MITFNNLNHFILNLNIFCGDIDLSLDLHERDFTRIRYNKLHQCYGFGSTFNLKGIVAQYSRCSQERSVADPEGAKGAMPPPPSL